MSKKLEEQELKELQGAINKINEIQIQIRGVELQKQDLVLFGAEAGRGLTRIASSRGKGGGTSHL